MQEIQKKGDAQVEFFRSQDKLLEAQRIEQRTAYDLEMLTEYGDVVLDGELNLNKEDYYDNFIYFTRKIKRYIMNHVIPADKKLQELENLQNSKLEKYAKQKAKELGINEIEVYSNMYNLDDSIIASLINVESSYKADAKSNKNAIGLMQIKLTTANYLNELNNQETIKKDIMM